MIAASQEPTQTYHSEARPLEQLAPSTEWIARQGSLDTILAAVTGMIEWQMPGARCVVRLREDERLYNAAAAPQASLGHGQSASWSVPIYSREGHLVGMIDICQAEPCHPDPAHFDLVHLASRLVAVSVEQRQLTDRLAYQAYHDALTGLPNRFNFEARMTHAIAWARRHNDSVGLLSVDLDHFKRVNDTFGHVIGDGLLRQVARRFEGCVRETDVVARWGGDEFMIGLTELNSFEDAGLVAEKLLSCVSRPFDIEGHVLTVTATVGVSVYPNHGEDLPELMKTADRALYHAKNRGRNGYFCRAQKRRYEPDFGCETPASAENKSRIVENW